MPLLAGAAMFGRPRCDSMQRVGDVRQTGHPGALAGQPRWRRREGCARHAQGTWEVAQEHSWDRVVQHDSPKDSVDHRFRHRRLAPCLAECYLGGAMPRKALLPQPVQLQTAPKSVLNVALHARILAEGTAKASTWESAMAALERESVARHQAGKCEWLSP